MPIGYPVDGDAGVEDLYTKYDLTYTLRKELEEFSSGEDYQMKIYPVYNNPDVDISGYPIAAYGIAGLAYGSYPSDSSQVVLGELAAYRYIADNDIDDINDVVGETIELSVGGKESEFTISGVAIGGLDYYTDATFFDMDYSTYSYQIDFASKSEKEEYINDQLVLNDVAYLDSENYNFISIRIKLFIIMSIVIVLTIVLINAKKFGGMLSILNAYKKRSSSMLIYIIPSIICVVFLVGLYTVMYL